MTFVSSSILLYPFAMSSPIDPHIFRAYDIRGKALTQLTADACYSIGLAFGTILWERYGEGKIDYQPTIALGRDARTHGPQLELQLKQGLIDSGCKVLLIGAVPSPVNYFIVHHLNLDGGVQITASHNPKEDNGIKLQTRKSASFSGEDLQVLRRRIERGSLRELQGIAEEIDAIKPYTEQLSTLFKGVGKGMKIVVDAGNGIAGPVNVQILKKVGCQVIELYTDPDGTFPNHAADPSKHETLKELQAKVIAEKAICGFAYDGDGDRMGLVDERGQILSADQVLLLLAQDHLSRHPGAPVIFTVSNSGILQTEIAKWGGVPHMCKVGHSYVEHAMHEFASQLGGEQSGHFFCGEDYYGFDDALAASLRVLSILAAQSHSSLSRMVETFPKVYQAHERRPHCPDDRKAQVITALTDTFQQAGYPVETMDGARVDFGDSAWAGIRQSNTSPCLSICLEARSPEKLTEIEEIVLHEVRKFPEVEL